MMMIGAIIFTGVVLGWVICRQLRRGRHQAACKQCGKVHSAYGLSSRKPPSR